MATTKNLFVALVSAVLSNLFIFTTMLLNLISASVINKLRNFFDNRRLMRHMSDILVKILSTNPWEEELCRRGNSVRNNA